MSTSLIFSSLPWHGAAKAMVKKPTQTQDNGANSSVEHRFATWCKHNSPILPNSDRVWHVSDLDYCYSPSAIFVTRNSLFGQLFFSRRDDGGNLILAVDDNDLQTLIPGPDTFEHRINLLPESPIGSLCEGRPMGDDITISTCEGKRRPQFLYRAIHSQYAGHGLEARGMNAVQPDALDFQIHLENHLDWPNRNLSPFLSVTSDLNKAVRLCRMFKAQHRTDVQLLMVDTQKPGWEHNTQRLWDLKELVRTFGLEWKPYYSDEYLIEQSIPWESLLFRMDWDEKAEANYEDYETFRIRWPRQR